MAGDHEERWREVEATVGRAVVLWSRAEFLIGMTFRAALHGSSVLGAFVARTFSTDLMLSGLALVARDAGADRAPAEAWVRHCTRLNKRRNALFHGSYADQSDGTTWHPTIIWMSRRGTGTAPDHLDVERFDHAAFAGFTADCREAFLLHRRLPPAWRRWMDDADGDDVGGD